MQLQELFEVRHSVFIVGNAGTGKSCVWKSLFKANQNMKKKPTAIDLNPKAVTNDELFGIINPATREWKDGEFASIESISNFERGLHRNKRLRLHVLELHVVIPFQK